jgi:hypothetical protein
MRKQHHQFVRSLQKVAPASIWASSKKGTAPHISISRAACFAIHVSGPL